MKEASVVLVACHKTAEVLEPTDRSLHFPPTTVSPQRSAILCRRLNAVLAMRTDQFDATLGQSRPQWIAVGGRIVDQAARFSPKHALLEKRLDESYFVRAGTGGIHPERKTTAVGENQDLGPLAPLGLANLFAPFFAEENVPSAKDSSCIMWPCRSSRRSSRAQAFSQMPASVHAFNRRQHVAGEGNCLGRRFQGAPVRRIQRIPSAQGREATRGRPPFGPTGKSGNRSAMRFHCSSVSSRSGSVVDPAGDSTAPRDRFAMRDLLSVDLYTANTQRWFSPIPTF